MPESRVTGTFEKLTIGDERVAAFIPAPLPPRDPLLVLDDRASALLGRAEQGLRRLDGAQGLVPGLDWLDQAMMRKEAVASARLAGDHSTLTDLFADESRTETRTGEAGNVLDALSHCREELERPASGPRISMRLLNRMHRRLMNPGGAPARTPELLRGAVQARAPGQLRSIPTWVGAARPGNATYVPPPPFEIRPLLEQVEEFVHREARLPALVRIALIHAQFASIRPYLDGNGRVGRMLIPLLLGHWRLLRAPILCLSVFFNRQRADYHRLLAAVRTEGDWESWTTFFLGGVASISAEGVETARSLLEQVAKDRDLVLSSPRASVAGLRLFAQLPSHPMVTVPLVVKLLETTPPTAAKAVALLESLGVLRECSGRKRHRMFSYERYLELLSSGMD